MLRSGIKPTNTNPASVSSTPISRITLITQKRTPKIEDTSNEDLLDQAREIRLERDIAFVEGIQQMMLATSTWQRIYLLTSLAKTTFSLRARKSKVKKVLKSRGLKLPRRKRTVVQIALNRAIPFVIHQFLKLRGDIRTSLQIQRAAQLCIEDLKRQDRSRGIWGINASWIFRLNPDYIVGLSSLILVMCYIYKACYVSLLLSMHPLILLCMLCSSFTFIAIIVMIIALPYFSYSSYSPILLSAFLYFKMRSL
ncbi:hypothetical protein B0J17DRAFT_458881 [Rhizoctonia solani]|nr:hypothetical protein B0J17DRAFT_458881 [Rhizoctonia solani]